jgi:hypothetical protein
MRFLHQHFFLNQPWALSIPLGLFQILTKSQIYFIFVSVIVSDDKFIASVNNMIFVCSQCNVLPVQQQRRKFTTTLMLIFYWYPLATSQSKHFIRNHYMSVRCNPTTSQQNMNKLSVSKLFSFIAGAVNTGD